MSLSEQELRALREIEQSLMADDPKFGSSVSGVDFSERTVSINLQGVALVVLGLTVLVGGIALSQQNIWFVALSVVGFLIMFGASVWMIRGGSRVDSVSSRPRNVSLGGGVRPVGIQDNTGAGFTDRLDERFRNRFEDRP